MLKSNPSQTRDQGTRDTKEVDGIKVTTEWEAATFAFLFSCSLFLFLFLFHGYNTVLMTENVPFLHFSPTNTSCVVHRLKQGTDTNHRHKFPTSLEMNHFKVFIVADMIGRAIAYADRNIPNNPGGSMLQKNLISRSDPGPKTSLRRLCRLTGSKSWLWGDVLFW